MIKFKIYINKIKQKEVKLLRDRETIGRSARCTLCLTDSSVSSRHAVVRKVDKGILIEDQDSKNGVFVNETQVKSCLLKPGDKIRLGRVGLLVDDISH